MYILIGRTPDYAWSLTSAGHDVRDVYAEQLCEPDGSAPTRASTHYVFKGECTAVRELQRGHCSNGQPLTLPRVGARARCSRPPPSAASPTRCRARRSTFGRDALNLGALKDMTEGKATHALALLADREQVRLHLQLGLRLAQGHGVLLLRAAFPSAPRGLDRRLPTLGTGAYEWRRLPAASESIRTT